MLLSFQIYLYTQHTSIYMHITLKKRKFVAIYTIRRKGSTLPDSLVTNTLSVKV